MKSHRICTCISSNQFAFRRTLARGGPLLSEDRDTLGAVIGLVVESKIVSYDLLSGDQSLAIHSFA